MRPLERADVLSKTLDRMDSSAKEFLDQRCQSELVRLVIENTGAHATSITVTGKTLELMLTVAKASTKEEIRQLLINYLENDT